ncbi:MAG TPA: crossover junction endodeoxyribonuclease RuvC [Acidimicrobiia bacterium]
MFAVGADAPILGIDPGVSCCGYGAIVRRGAQPHAVACGVLRTDPAMPLPERLALLWAELDQLVDELRPAAVVVERVLFQVNARTAISVGQASGLALVAAARRSIPVVQYSPNEVKLAIAGDGGAGKREVATMVAKLLRLAAPPSPADAADALALALCHAWRMRVPDGGAPSSDRLGAAIAHASANGAARERRRSDTGAERGGERSERPGAPGGASRRRAGVEA